MKIKNKIAEKEFDSVKTFREIKEKISIDLVDKTTEQILDFIRKNSFKQETDK